MFIRIGSSLILIVVLQQESNILIKSDTLLEKNTKTVSFVFTDSLIFPRKKKKVFRTLSVARYIKYHKLHATKFVCNNYFIHKGFILKNHYAWKMKPVKIR